MHSRKHCNVAGAHNESSVVRRQERDTPAHLIKIPNLHMMNVLLKIDWMMLYVHATTVSLVLAETEY